MDDLANYKGKPIEQLTKGELIIALKEMYAFYESRLETKDKIIELHKSYQTSKA